MQPSCASLLSRTKARPRRPRSARWPKVLEFPPAADHRSDPPAAGPENVPPAKASRQQPAPSSPPEASTSTVPSVELGTNSHEALPSISQILSPAVEGSSPEREPVVPRARSANPDSPGFTLHRRTPLANITHDGASGAAAAAGSSTDALKAVYRLKAEVDDSAVEDQTVEALLLLGDST